MITKNNRKIYNFFLIMLICVIITGCTQNNNVHSETMISNSTKITTKHFNQSENNLSELEKLVIDGNKRYYTADELQNKSSYELSILRNGIFALSGKVFVTNQDVKAFLRAVGDIHQIQNILTW